MAQRRLNSLSDAFRGSVKSDVRNNPGASERKAPSRIASYSLRDDGARSYYDMTDNSMFGLSALQYVGDNIRRSFKIGIESKAHEVSLRIVDTMSLNRIEVCLRRTVRDPSICSSMFREMTSDDVEMYIHHSNLTALLMDKISVMPSVAARWLPAFSKNLEDIEVFLNLKGTLVCYDKAQVGNTQYAMEAETWGQRLVLLFTERLRNKVRSGISLRMLINGLSWLSTVYESESFRNAYIAGSAIIEAWIVEGTCEDCVFKMLRYHAPLSKHEYIHNLNDTFAKHIAYPEPAVVLEVLECDTTTDSLVSESLDDIYVLKPFSRHCVATSKSANVYRKITFKISEDDKPNDFRMTPREVASLTSVMELHARVLRASVWQSGAVAMYNWLKDNRCTPIDKRGLVLQRKLLELIYVYDRIEPLRTVIKHLVLLPTEGRLFAEMKRAYNSAYENKQRDAHAFVVKYIFSSNLSVSSDRYITAKIDEFRSASVKDRLALINFNISEWDIEYSLAQDSNIDRIVSDIYDGTPPSFIKDAHASDNVACGDSVAELDTTISNLLLGEKCTIVDSTSDVDERDHVDSVIEFESYDSPFDWLAEMEKDSVENPDMNESIWDQ